MRLSAAGLADADAVADGLAAAVVGLAEADDVVEEDGVADVAFVTVGELEAAGELVAAVGLDVRPASGGVTAHPPNASALATAPIKRALDTPLTTNEGTRRPEPGRNRPAGLRSPSPRFNPVPSGYGGPIAPLTATNPINAGYEGDFSPHNQQFLGWSGLAASRLPQNLPKVG